MVKTPSFKRLILRAVLRQVSPMVIRLVSVSDHMPLPEFHDVLRIILGWNGDLGYIIRVHGQEFNSFRRKTRSKALHEFKLHRQEKFLYVCDTLHMWEWDVRVLDGGGRLPKRRRGRTTPAGPDDRAAGTGDGNAWHEFDRERSVVGRRAGFCSRPTGARRVGATTCLSTLPQAVHDQGLRQHPS